MSGQVSFPRQQRLAQEVTACGPVCGAGRPNPEPDQSPSPTQSLPIRTAKLHCRTRYDQALFYPVPLRRGLARAGNDGDMWRSHSALAVFLIGTVVCGCAERKVDVEDTEEQKNQQILATYSHMTKFFDDCVERTARRRLASSGDAGAAIEQGFGACKAEESAVTERLDVGVKPGFGQQQIGPYKFRLKQRLLQVLATKEPIGAERRRGNTATDDPVRP